RALGRDDDAPIHELLDRLVVDRAEGITGGGDVMLRLQHAELMAAGNEHQRAIELVHLVEEDRDVHRSGLGHLVVGVPGAVVLVPLPDVSVERLLAVDLELVHVHVFAEQLRDRLYHAGVARQLGERVAIHVRRKIGAHHIAGLLADVLWPALSVEPRNLVGENFDFFRLEQAGKEEIALAVEPLLLLLGELHANASSTWDRSCAMRSSLATSGTVYRIPSGKASRDTPSALGRPVPRTSSAIFHGRALQARAQSLPLAQLLNQRNG